MAFEGRRAVIQKIESLREGRVLLCVFNFDRQSEPEIPGLSLHFQADLKESLFRVLKESTAENRRKIDLCLYTRGGDINAVWPVISLLREFDPDFEVLVPFRCHSSGTLVSLGAKRVILTKLSELSPIDPTTGNRFNPPDPANPNARLGISVEDVVCYRKFVLQHLRDGHGDAPKSGHEQEGTQNETTNSTRIAPFLQSLVEKVHPLALGNVHRVHLQIKKLARKLLELNPVELRNVSDVVDHFATNFYSHLHMINRIEAREILGKEQIVFANEELSDALDSLLRIYEDDFGLRKRFYISERIKDEPTLDARFIGGVVESAQWSYLFETKANIRQNSVFPPNVQVQLPAGQPMPIVPGLPRNISVDVTAQGWMHNKDPLGNVTR